jgi:oxaloacetate decarboxylase gamma subunit
MPVADLLLAGGELMLLGMGIVFGFLIILVFAMRGMSALAAFLDPDIEAESRSGAAEAVPQTPGQDQLVAVVSAAVARYRSARTH